MERKQNKTLAFCLFKYFPHGGLERDMLRIALACRSRGYEIDVYTTSWRGDLPESLRPDAASLRDDWGTADWWRSGTVE
jgi:UDP-glucose:(heptosyl)LPS alpha-1,3-glucosyltransferase